MYTYCEAAKCVYIIMYNMRSLIAFFVSSSASEPTCLWAAGESNLHMQIESYQLKLKGEANHMSEACQHGIALAVMYFYVIVYII